MEAVSLSLLNELHGKETILERRLPYHRAMRDTLYACGERLRPRSGGGPLAPGDDSEVPPLAELGFEYGLMTTGGFGSSALEGERPVFAIERIDPRPYHPWCYECGTRKPRTTSG